MTAKGTVIEIIDAKTAVVKTVRKSACEDCHAKQGKGCNACDIFLGKDTITTEVENEIGAVVGDEVEIGTPSGDVIVAATVVFMLPLGCAAIAYIISDLILFSDNAPLWSFIGLIIGFIAVYLYGKLRKKKEKISIVKIIGKETDLE